MPSLFSSLSIANTGLRTQQQGLNVTAHNIANASTDGYTRQEAELKATPAIHTTDGVFGTGAAVHDVRRISDPLLDASFYRATGGASEFSTRASMLGRVEDLFGEPTELGLGAALDSFHSAWSGLAANPSSPTLRSAVAQSARQLTDVFHTVNNGLDAIRQEVEARLEVGVDDASRLTGEIARLNREIMVAESDGSTAGDLRDERARRLGDLAELLPINVVERQDGSVGVTVSGLSIVDGATYQTLEVRQSGSTYGIGIVGRPGTFPDSGGALGGLLTVLNTDIPTVQAGLDDLASALVTEINAIHVTGTNPLGTTGIDFFDPAGVTAGSISISAAIQADTQNVAASTPDGLGGYRAGANDVALALAGLRDTASPALGKSFGDHYRGLVFDLGQEVRSSSDESMVQRTLADQADVRRMELGGVAVDEELVQMIQFQTAYQASARVVSAVDEMLQTLVMI